MFRNQREGPSGDDADFKIMILPKKGFELVRCQCELRTWQLPVGLFYISETIGLNAYRS